MTEAARRGVFRTLSHSTLTLVLVWGLLRIYAFLAAYDNLPYPNAPWVSSDVLLFAHWAPGLSHFAFPINDERWQYPPGAGILLTLPQWPASLLHIQYDQAFQVLVLIADVALLVVLILGGRRLGARAGGLAGAWLWALAPIYFGPMLAARFDTVAALCAVSALVLLYIHRPTWAGGFMGVGLLVKAWPVLMVLGAKRRDWPRALLGVVVGAVIVTVVGLRWAHSWSFLSNELHRGLQIESVGALPYVIGWRFGHMTAYGYSFGALEIHAASAHAVGLALTAVGFVLLGLLFVLRMMGRLEKVAIVDVAFAALLVSVATSRVYSPQYNIWLIALGAAVLLDRNARTRLAIWFVVGASICGQLVYPIFYTQLMQGLTSGVGLQTLRIVFLLAATVVAYVQVLRGALTKQTANLDQDQPQPATV